MRRRGRHAGSPLVGGTPAGGPGTSAAHGPFRRHLALVLPVALALAVAAAAAATSVETASVEDQVTAVAADGDDVWVGRSVEGGRFRAGRFSAGGSLEREVLLALPDAELVGRWLLVDRRGRLWLNAWSEDGEGNLRTQAVAFTPRGRPSSRHDVTGWDPPRVSPQGEVFISKRSDEGGEEALIFARLDPQGIQPLFSLSRGEYFGPPADRGDQWLVTTPLAAGRFAVLRTWASDGWLSVYDASGRRHARWPFRVADGRLSEVALAPGPEGGVTIAYRTVLGAGEGLVRVESYRVGGERLHTAVLPADARLDLAADRSGGSWVPDGSGPCGASHRQGRRSPPSRPTLRPTA